MATAVSSSTPPPQPIPAQQAIPVAALSTDEAAPIALAPEAPLKRAQAEIAQLQKLLTGTLQKPTTATEDAPMAKGTARKLIKELKAQNRELRAMVESLQFENDSLKKSLKTARAERVVIVSSNEHLGI